MSDKPEVKISKKITDPNAPEEKPIYDAVTTTQQAINMAIAENRVVRYKTTLSNQEIKDQIDDKKDCLLRKPDREANEVAIIPPGIEDFTFDKNVDETIILQSRKSNIWLPGDN
ncbi:MAG: hypothetical protein GY714_20140 [Desulfobacterales bacterium]|nr:hypothetical protein [Desulfobacterales bacterium]